MRFKIHKSAPFGTFGVLAVLLLVGVRASHGGASEPEYPPVAKPSGDEAAQFGRNIQRTMTLSATSTPEHRHKVKILFYGQSITEGAWWKAVAADLRERFPHTDLEIENRAIGGFASQRLYRVAEHDVPAFYPDLVIFHVYGAHTTYEMLIQMIRSRTAAEIAIWTDHVGRDNKKNDAGEYIDEGWTAFMAKFIRQVAQRYDCGYLEIREPYKQYLYQHQLEAGALLKDGIHPNDHGGFVLAELIGRQLVYNPKLGLGPSEKLSTTYVVGEDVDFVDDTLELKFKGNRVDLIPTPTADTGKPAVAVRIDGRAPSEYPGCYAYTRPSRAAGTWGPGILRVTFEEKPLVEDWTARVTSYDPATKGFQFEVIGSKTGPDGTGSSDRDFVSNSKRVVIKAHVKPPGVGEQSDWRMEGTIPVGFEVKWKCIPMFADRYEPPAVTDPTREHAETVAQGFPNGDHTLTLKLDGQGPPGIHAVRVYSPPWK